MRIELANKEFVYNFLKNPPHVNRVPGDEWKQLGGQQDKDEIGVNCPLENIRLASPLSCMGGIFKRRGRYYSGIVWVEAKDEKTFLDFPNQLRSRLKEKTTFREVSGDGGFIFHDGVPYFAVTPQEPKDRAIGLGCFGVPLVELGEFDDFTHRVTELEKMASILVDSYIGDSFKVDNSKQDYTLFLGPR